MITGDGIKHHWTTFSGNKTLYFRDGGVSSFDRHLTLQQARDAFDRHKQLLKQQESRLT